MPPRKVQRTNESKSSMVPNPSCFSNSNVGKYFVELQVKTFIQERGFDLLVIICTKIWLLVRYHRWERFWMIPKDIAVVPIVQEFYASLRDQEFRSTKGHIWETVHVEVTPRIICDFYNSPCYEKDFIDEIDLEYFQDIDVDNIINFLTEGRGEYKYRPDMFWLTHLEKKEEAHESEEEREDELEGDDEIDFEDD
ncbi:hypothetical protein Gogos_017190 [Gossypium gossypioides]|uniref:Uncharacterized protein n=1 Tax=Gossypium gossypioides TaxID=34282 RepID=A0A7J9B9X4_GOSGO|nr:hypothetical protein [Gossypium gossypioides]